MPDLQDGLVEQTSIFVRGNSLTLNPYPYLSPIQNTTVTETFAKQLLQFSGLTAEKALAITQRYRTPAE